MEEIDSKTASRYRKECETGRRQVNKKVNGKQVWVDGPTVPEDELAAQSEALKRYEAKHPAPRHIKCRKTCGARLLARQGELREEQEKQAKELEQHKKENRAEVTKLAEEQEKQAGTLDAHAKEMHENGQ